MFGAIYSAFVDPLGYITNSSILLPDHSVPGTVPPSVGPAQAQPETNLALHRTDPGDFASTLDTAALPPTPAARPAGPPSPTPLPRPTPGGIPFQAPWTAAPAKIVVMAGPMTRVR